jgi:hypothetical protein
MPPVFLREATMRRIVGCFALVALAVMAGAPAPGFAQTRETAGLVTEIKIGKGKAEVKPSSGDWRPAGPLQSLRAGDHVRASDDATLVVVLSGGRGTMKVNAQNSPWAVPAAASDSKAQKAQAVVASSMGFLSRDVKEPPKAVLSTRAGGGPPEILTPRNGPVLGDAMVFEWMGSQFSRYVVRISGPAGVVVEKKGVVGARFAYPADAPALEPGVRYMFQVEAVGQPVQTSTFEILAPARAIDVRAGLGQLEASLGVGASANSVTVLQAGALASAGLLHDARVIVLAALARDPDEPTLHTILGNLYMQTGLERQAAEAFDEAKFLLSRDR